MHIGTLTTYQSVREVGGFISAIKAGVETISCVMRVPPHAKDPDAMEIGQIGHGKGKGKGKDGTGKEGKKGKGKKNKREKQRQPQQRKKWQKQ